MYSTGALRQAHASVLCTNAWFKSSTLYGSSAAGSRGRQQQGRRQVMEARGALGFEVRKQAWLARAHQALSLRQAAAHLRTALAARPRAP